MEDLPLEKISITGPTMAAILQQFLSSPGDCDGLLFGHFRSLSLLNLPDDDDHQFAAGPPDSGQNLTATVTGHFFSGVPQSFYDATGVPNFDKLGRVLCNRDRGELLIGWFSGRRKTALWPSMREFSVSYSLCNSDPSTFQTRISSPETLILDSGSPCVFILFSGSFHHQSIHTHEYRAFQFRRNDVFEPKSLDIVNIGPAFRGNYNAFSPISPFPWLSFGDNCCLREEMGEDYGKKNQKRLNQLGVESGDGGLLKLGLCAEGFSVSRLSRLMGSEAASYTSELEDLYRKMLVKIEQLARQVEKSSAQVLDQVDQLWKKQDDGEFLFF